MLKRKKIIEDFITPQVAKLGFEKVKVVEPYCPLRLNAYAGDIPLAENCDVSQTSRQQKHFKKGQWYKLYVMFAKDENAKMVMYCKENKEDELYKIVEGSFVFEFNATMFFHILLFADIDVWRAFTRYITVKDKQEIDKFASMVYDSSSLFEDQQRVGALFIENLYKGLY